MAANMVGLLIVAYLATKKSLTAEYIDFRLSFFKQIPEYIALAADVGLNTGFTLLALLVFVYIIEPLGAVALTVHQITLQIFNFAYLPAMGFLITASIIVPQLLEHKQEYLLMPTVSRLCKMSFSSCLLFIFSSTVSHFFSPTDKLVVEQAAKTLKLICFGLLIMVHYRLYSACIRFYLQKSWCENLHTVPFSHLKDK